MVENIVKTPFISVVMPAYNASQYLKQAIDSILNQTYTNFEFIIINDGSTDDTESIIQSYIDKRIKYFINPVNLGIVETLNRGISLAQGKYLARMDADDISLPDRFEKQFNLMENNPQVAVCGSQAFIINDLGIKTDQPPFPTTHNEIKPLLLLYNTFIHPTTFFKTEIIKKYKYLTEYHYAEDYYLLAQIASKYTVANHPEQLLLYRIHEQNTTSTKRKEMDQAHIKVIDYQLSNLLREKVSPSFLTEIYNLSLYKLTPNSIPVYSNILNILLNANKQNHIYDQRIFHDMLHRFWYSVIFGSGKKNAIFTFLRSPLLSWNALTFKQLRRIVKTSLKSLFN